MDYIFKNISECIMCGSSSYKVLGKRLNKSQGHFPSNKLGVTTTVVKCRSCGLIYSNPMPIPNDFNDHYGVPPEQYWNDKYFEVDPSYFKGEIEWLEKLKPTVSGMKSLDIGAGIGKQMVALSRYGFESYGLEPSEPFYNRAIERMDIQKSRLQNTTIEKAIYEENLFDFISFGVVLEHLYDPAMAIAKALSWLKPGGLIHIEVPSANWLISRIVNLSYQFRGMDYVSNISPMHAPYHLYEFTLDSFHKNSLQKNYKLVDSGYYVCKTFLPKIVDPVIKKVMQKTDTGMQLVVWLSKNK
ncbi:MAG: 2-polyprenyl-3-methyl-5-hydroxy-6-metoxy-1,4-benzoquinol methylase [Parvicella sp.]|jgi:2-polyprenyl-3-methyl-5-hydroxy-6-metoxy-1,4-benzoquinol methylase